MNELEKISITAFITFISTFVATYFNERRKEKQLKLKCIEIIINSILDIRLPSLSMGNSIVLKARKNSPGSEYIDVKKIYTSVYLIKNISTRSIGPFVLKAQRDKSMPLWFHITQGQKKMNPDWDNKLIKLLQDTKENEEIGWANFHIPYLNPYRSSGEKVFLLISSYMALDKIKVCGGSEGLSFRIKKIRLFRNLRAKLILNKYFQAECEKKN